MFLFNESSIGKINNSKTKIYSILNMSDEINLDDYATKVISKVEARISWQKQSNTLFEKTKELYFPNLPYYGRVFAQ